MATLTIRLTEKEAEMLLRYCLENGRTRTDVLREFIRTLDKTN